MARAGVNNPPTAPERRQAAVASGLSTISDANSSSEPVPSSATWVGPLPLPSSCGYAIATRPSTANTDVVETIKCHPVGLCCAGHADEADEQDGGQPADRSDHDGEDGEG